MPPGDFFFKETERLHRFAGGFPKHPRQVNGLLEADAEILKLSGMDEEYLILKTDGIYEEIKTGLYKDPYLIGWMGITASLSDMAAVGGSPAAILLSVVLKQNEDEKWLQQFKQGIKDACSAYNVYVAGGDTNYDDFCSISTTAVGFIKDRKPMLRKGMQPGDYLYSTSSLGLGNAFAYSRFFDASFQVNYFPQARLKESIYISQYASACIDTSDGLFPALAFLTDLNHIGFDLDVPLNSLLHDDAVRCHQQAGLPSWMFMGGPHGEYELLFTVPAEVNDAFMKNVNDEFFPVYIGKVISDSRLNFISEDLKISCHAAEIPNLFYEANGDVQAYFKLLMEQHKNWTSVKLKA